MQTCKCFIPKRSFCLVPVPESKLKWYLVPNVNPDTPNEIIGTRNTCLVAEREGAYSCFTSISFSRSTPVRSSAIQAPFSSSVAVWKPSARRIVWTSRSVT